MKVKGVITVYLTLIFLLVVAVIFTAVESARLQTSRMLTETAMDSAMESFLAGYQRELYEQYDLFFFDGAFGEQTISGEQIAGKLEDYMDYTLHPTRDTWLNHTDFYQMNQENASIEKIALATDDQGRVFRSQAVASIRSSVGLDVIESLMGNYDWAVNNLSESNAYTSKEQETQSSLVSLEADKAKAEEEKAEEAKTAKEQENPAVEVDAIRSMGILELMYEDTSQVSQKCINKTSLPSQRKLNQGNGLEEYETGVVSNILFQNYLMKKFTHAASTKQPTDENLQYQLEYLLIGKEHDVDNLKGMINRLLWIREGANFAYLLTDAGKVAQAYAAASLLVGFTCLPPLIEATKYIILLSWAYAESVLDVKVLLAGEKVALIKHAANWKTSLSNLGELTTKNVKSMGDKDGVSYEGYLQMLLLLANQEEVSMRALDLIEIQLQSMVRNQNLKMDHMVAMIEASVDVDSKSVFLSIPIMNGYSGSSQKNWKITRRFGYDQW